MMFKRTVACATAFVLWAATLFTPLEAMASQNALLSPTTGTVSGLQLTNNYNNALDSLNTCNSGGSAPTNQLTGVPSLGNCWLNTTNNSINFYDGASWNTVAWMDTSNHLIIGQIGGGVLSAVASASTANLCGASQASARGSNISVTGVVTITSFGSNCFTGQVKLLTFAGILTLTYNASSMILPTGANITTAAGDTAIAMYLGSGNWQVIAYQRASGSALSSSLNFTGALFVNSQLAPTSLSTSQNDYNPAGLSTANAVRLTSSAAVNITGLVAPATNGQRLTLQNVNAAGGFNITLTSNDAGSTAANRFLFPHPVGLQPLQSVTVVYDATSSGWRLEQKIYASPVQGNFKNLRVFNVATVFGDTAPSTPNSQIKIAADEVVLEDGSGNSTRSASVACTIDFTTNGAGGLDTSSLAAGNWYFMFVIFNPSTNATSCLGSLQSSIGSVTLPSGYTFAARVGGNSYLTRNAITGFYRIVQYGRHATIIVATSTPTNNLPNLAVGSEGSISVPTWVAKPIAGIQIPVTASRVDLVMSTPIGTGTSLIMAAPNNGYGAYSSTTNPAPCVTGAPNGVGNSQICSFNIEGSGDIYTANNNNNALLQVAGWEDNL